jgi:DNA-binding transcriptional LysR family regulator
MRFTLRQLEYFIATAETGSITVASTRVSISQPSISTAISHLERELGVQLFVRHHAQGLSLTPAGRALLIEAKQLVKHADGLYSAAADLSQNLRGTLSVGCMLTLAPILMPELSQSFTNAYPETVIRQQALDQAGLLEGLRRTEVDVALTYDLEIGSDIAFSPLVDLPPYALFGASDPFHRKKVVTLAELASRPLILLDLPLSTGYFLALFMKERLTPTIASRSPHLEVVRAMVGNGFGYTLMNARPLCEVALDGRRLYRVRVAGDQPALVLGIATLKRLKKTHLIQAFEAHCQKSVTASHIPGMAPHTPERPRSRGRSA